MNETALLIVTGYRRCPATRRAMAAQGLVVVQEVFVIELWPTVSGTLVRSLRLLQALDDRRGVEQGDAKEQRGDARTSADERKASAGGILVEEQDCQDDRDRGLDRVECGHARRQGTGFVGTLDEQQAENRRDERRPELSALERLGQSVLEGGDRGFEQ
jgi:hypothetical protein